MNKLDSFTFVPSYWESIKCKENYRLLKNIKPLKCLVTFAGPNERSPILLQARTKNGVNMVRLGGRRGYDDLGPVTDGTDRVHGCTVADSSRGTRGRHSTSDLSATPTSLAPGFHHGIGALGTHGYSHANFSVSSSEPYIGKPVDRVCEGDRGFEGDRGLGEEHDRVRSLHMEGEADEGGDDDGDRGSWFIEVPIALHGTHRVDLTDAQVHSLASGTGIWGRHHVLMQRSLVGTGVDISVLSHVCTRGQTGFLSLQAIHPAVSHVGL
ncbi:hypothetical protein M9H77_28848 [Catharanthus roseus]|uniref:Uncharacterized protein n=1 Tax=Catharanthus roseus TaxID=4058 RepID=A0ACC0AGS1_CATRO|nr:hypothetical protein M9H77_28848 [Catharanthus roseus]